jgi:hypothetical protein
MYSIVTALPAVVALCLWATWFEHGESSTPFKVVVLLLIASALWLQFLSEHGVVGLVMQSFLAILLLMWNAWHSARHW